MRSGGGDGLPALPPAQSEKGSPPADTLTAVLLVSVSKA